LLTTPTRVSFVPISAQSLITLAFHWPRPGHPITSRSSAAFIYRLMRGGSHEDPAFSSFFHLQD
jgi:hypothetical protein